MFDSRKLLALGAAATVAAVVASAQAATAPPANTSLPTISGTAQQGHTLTAYHGGWSGSPTSYSYKWDRCDTSGDICKSIDIFRRQYTLTSADVGHTMRVVVTATNAGGSTGAMSRATAVVVASGSTPANVVKPSISGDPREGSALSASPGTWTGTHRSRTRINGTAAIRRVGTAPRSRGPRARRTRCRRATSATRSPSR